MKTIAIIPARSGSKRIPKKNIKDFNGVPMLGRTISKLKDSKLFSDIIVSTDSEQISSLALKYGASVPFLRKKNLSDDHATTYSVILDALSEIKESYAFDYVCCIYPATPLLKIEILEEAIYILDTNSSIDFVLPIIEYNHPLDRAMSITNDGEVNFLKDAEINSRTQDKPKHFHDSGQFYLGRKDSFETNTNFFEGKTYGIQMKKYSVIDIDEEEDWNFAEKICQIIDK